MKEYELNTGHPMTAFLLSGAMGAGIVSISGPKNAFHPCFAEGVARDNNQRQKGRGARRREAQKRKAGKK